ncbi:MAG TPA: MBL fold metallo-hydrolase [Gemmatimonadaceae bacterium]|nr:MBL fold metallo-hydrolase [Gemmatimonadaceae bacterium]
MQVTILGSGSRGNAVILEADGARVLVDAGFNARTLATRMAAAEIAPESIGAVVLTHEHTDHVTGVCTAARRWGWQVFATAGTIAAVPGLPALRPHTIAPGEALVLDTMALRCVRTPHDATEPVAVVVDARASGTRVGIAYDLGHVPAGIEHAMRHVDALILESNHDEEMLRAGPYPRVVQDRIAGRHGHLSNAEAAALAQRVAHRNLQHLVLAHLSQQNNTPDVARATVSAALRPTAFRGALSVARQDAVMSFDVDRKRRVEQLSLF